MTRQGIYFVAVVLAAVLWGTTGTIQALLPEARDPFAVGAFRMAFAAITLWIATAFIKKVSAEIALPWGGLVGAGAAMAAYNFFFFQGVSLAGVGLGTALTIGSAPIWVTLFDIARYQRYPSMAKLVAQGLAIVGAVVLAFGGDSGSASVTGILLALGAGASYAVYSLLTSAMPKDIPSLRIATLTFSIAALFMAPLFFWVPIAWAWSPPALALLIALGAIATGGAYVLYTWGLRAVPAASAVTLALAEPLTAWILATVIVGEEVTVLKLIGAVVLFLGLVLMTRADLRR